MQTILVIDDDPVFVRAAESMLAEAGYRAVHATDGKEAARLLDKMNREIDLAIVDLALPNLNGFELIGAITRRPNAMKIIATSGVFGDLQLETATTLGAHAAIRKPPVITSLPRNEWLGTIQKLIGSKRKTAQD